MSLLYFLMTQDFIIFDFEYEIFPEYRQFNFDITDLSSVKIYCLSLYYFNILWSLRC
jgi:hypothetical protein